MISRRGRNGSLNEHVLITPFITYFGVYCYFNYKGQYCRRPVTIYMSFHCETRTLDDACTSSIQLALAFFLMEPVLKFIICIDETIVSLTIVVYGYRY